MPNNPQTTPAYRCGCGRMQSKIGVMSGELITQADLEKIGWVKVGPNYFCPFCSGNEKKLQGLFEGGTNV